jgi:hypothetical protein
MSETISSASKPSIQQLLKRSLLFLDISIQRGTFGRKELYEVLNFATDIENTLQQYETSKPDAKDGKNTPKMTFSGL